LLMHCLSLHGLIGSNVSKEPFRVLAQ